MENIKLEEINEEYRNNFFDSLKKNTNLNLIQYYSPYYKYISKDADETKNLFTLKNITEVKTKIELYNEEKHLKEQINKLYNIEYFDGIQNNMSLECSINKNYNEIINEELMCKVSPILNPIFMFNDDTTLDINKCFRDDEVPEEHKEEIEDPNNFAYVESFILYTLSCLTEANITPAFPIFYGSVNGIAKNYYFNITEYIDDFYGTKTFDKIKKIYKVLYVDHNDLSSDGSSSKTSSLKSTTSTDLETVHLNENETPLNINTDDEISNTISKDTDFFDLLKNKETKSKNINELSTDELNFTSINSEDKKELQEDKIKNAETMDDLFNDFEFIKDKNDYEENQLFPDLDLKKISKADKFSPNNKYMYVLLENYPVNYCFMEKLDFTLEDYLEEHDNEINDLDWLSIFFQLAHALATANKLLNFIHNDLHECNIMFTKTEEEYIYYKINGKLYAIPTYGKILKIIDFARSCIEYNGRWVLSNHYKPVREAYGIYDYPNDDGKYDEDAEHLPNPSFDLVRFFTTIAPYVEDENPEIYNLIYKWSYDDEKEENMIDEDNDFELYCSISHNCHNTKPVDFLKDEIFELFEFNTDIISETNIYDYDKL